MLRRLPLRWTQRNQSYSALWAMLPASRRPIPPLKLAQTQISKKVTLAKPNPIRKVETTLAVAAAAVAVVAVEIVVRVAKAMVRTTHRKMRMAIANRQVWILVSRHRVRQFRWP